MNVGISIEVHGVFFKAAIIGLETIPSLAVHAEGLINFARVCRIASRRRHEAKLVWIHLNLCMGGQFTINITLYFCFYLLIVVRHEP